MKKEMKNRNKAISTLNNILGYYYEGNGFTETSIYICENKLIDELYFALDTLNLSEIMEDNMIIVLSQILTIYLKKYNNTERMFLNFLKNIKTFDQDMLALELKKVMDGYNLIDPEESLLNMKRYNNLKLIDLTDEQINYMYGIVNGLNASAEIKEKEKQLRRVQTTVNQKLTIYEDILRDLFEQYKSGKSIDEICEQIDNKAETFYNNVMFIKDYLDLDIRSFSIKLANYYYENFLAKKYKITYFYNKNLLEACENLYNETHISPGALDNQFNSYIKYSPIMNNQENLLKIESRKKFLSKAALCYFKIFEKKQSERRSKNRQIVIDKNVIKAEKLLSDIIITGKTIEEYCMNNNIEMSDISNALATLKRSNSSIYNEFNSYCDRIYYNKKQHILNDIFNIVEMIRKGVKTKNGTREFDVIDYYQNTDISLINIDFIRDNLPKSDLITLLTFIKNNTLQESYLELSPENILKTTYYINNEKNLVKEISLADKERIMLWLENNNIPLNSITFIATLKRFGMGNLDLDELTSCNNNIKTK